MNHDRLNTIPSDEKLLKTRAEDLADDADEMDQDEGFGGGAGGAYASAFDGDETSLQMIEALEKEAKRRGLDEEVEEDLVDLDQIDDILALPEDQFPRFTLAKNKARFLRMVSWYKNKQEWLEVAPLSGVQKMFKQQTKELVGIRASKLDFEMELETGTLTPSQRSYRRDELKMCKVHEKMAVNLIAKMQVKIKSGRR